MSDKTGRKKSPRSRASQSHHYKIINKAKSQNSLQTHSNSKVNVRTDPLSQPTEEHNVIDKSEPEKSYVLTSQNSSQLQMDVDGRSRSITNDGSFAREHESSSSERYDDQQTFSLSPKHRELDNNMEFQIEYDSLLLKLPDDVLYTIFSFLNTFDLCKLCSVCSQLNRVCSRDTVWLRHSTTNFLHTGLSYRKQCTNKELCRITKNWEEGRFHHSFRARHTSNLIPWLQKDDNEVWFSFGNVIRNFQYDHAHGWKERKKRALHGMKRDATRFAVKHDMVASGCRDGCVHLWNISDLNHNHSTIRSTPHSEILCVDLTDRAIVSGSRDGKCTVHSLSHLHDNGERSANSARRKFDAKERVWSLKVSPCERFFIAGLAGYLDSSPLVIGDLESGRSYGRLNFQHRRGAGILDMKFESEHEILTCGYDTILRLWDLRTHQCVSEWVEPYDYTLFSIASAGGNAIAVGTARHGLVRLWDKRSTNHVQCFYSKHSNSPVYSLAMDYKSLLLAVDKGFSTMDFSAR